ncbi:hypothetical protein GN156_10235 [bacterium LRH843]|nr:hypothetical protein [bacterium LRH843]
MSKLSIPLLSLIYFTMAIVWTFGAFLAFGQPFFWLLLILIPANIFAGIKIMKRQHG